MFAAVVALAVAVPIAVPIAVAIAVVVIIVVALVNGAVFVVATARMVGWKQATSTSTLMTAGCCPKEMQKDGRSQIQSAFRLGWLPLAPWLGPPW